jgi:hypothetical protein
VEFAAWSSEAWVGAGDFVNSLSACLNGRDGLDVEVVVDRASWIESTVVPDDMLGLVTASKLASSSFVLVLLAVFVTVAPKSKSAKLPLNPSLGERIIVALWP